MGAALGDMATSWDDDQGHWDQGAGGEFAYEDLADLARVCDGGMCGVYDFSGTNAGGHCYLQLNLSLTKEDVDAMKKCWWDGASTAWSSDDDFKSLVNGSHADCKEDSQGKHAWKATKDGDEYMLMRRQAFGDGDKQHYVVCNKSTPNKKKGFVVGHGDFTAVVGCFENDTDYPSGSVITKLQAICESYKEQGY